MTTATDLAQTIVAVAADLPDHKPKRSELWDNCAASFVDGLPNSLLGQALAKHELDGEHRDSWNANTDLPSEVLAKIGVELSDRMAVWFDAIAKAEDGGATWGEAVEAAGAIPQPPRIREMPEVIQGTEEWHDQRRGIVTASAVGKLITPKTLKPASNPESRGFASLLVAERITGWTDPTFVSDDMLRGMEDEPRARDKYIEHYAPVREIGFMIRDDWGFPIGYSPDGLVGDDGLIEIKSRRQKKHLETILSGHPPIENMAQLQCGLLVSGRKWIDYVSFCGGMPMWVKRVFPDQKWFDAITSAVRAFEENAAEMIRIYSESVEGLAPTERFIEQEIVI